MLQNTYYIGMEKNDPSLEGGWLSVHIYSGLAPDVIVKHAVHPLVTELLNTRRIERFFFVRYFDRGPHVRLRLQVSDGQGDEGVKALIANHLSFFFAGHPSADEKTINNSEHLRDCFLYIKYEPELARYGGPQGVLLAEQQFGFSSKASLAVVSGGEHSAYDSRVAAAVLMHASFLLQLDFEDLICSKVLKCISTVWASYALSSGVRTMPTARMSEEHLFELFEGAFCRQRHRFECLIGDLRMIISGDADVKQAWLKTWIEDISHFAPVFHAIVPRLEIVAGQPHGECFETLLLAQKSTLVDSYIHMTNNRLGIQNKDEAYIAYILYRLFDQEAKEGDRR